MNYRIQNTRWQLARQYAFRWLFVPRLWQRIVRYSILPLVVILLFFQNLVPIHLRAGAVFFYAGISVFYYLMPLLSLVWGAVRADLAETKAEFDFESKKLLFETETIKGEIPMDRIVGKKIRPTFCYLIFKDKPDNGYLYFFKESVLENQFENLVKDIEKIEIGETARQENP